MYDCYPDWFCRLIYVREQQARALGISGLLHILRAHIREYDYAKGQISGN
jgi:hypothetical protein